MFIRYLSKAGKKDVKIKDYSQGGVKSVIMRKYTSGIKMKTMAYNGGKLNQFYKDHDITQLDQ